MTGPERKEYWHCFGIPFPYITFDDGSIVVHYLCTISSVYARYLFGLTPNIYWTCTGHVPDNYRTSGEVNPLLSSRNSMPEVWLEGKTQA